MLLTLFKINQVFNNLINLLRIQLMIEILKNSLNQKYLLKCKSLIYNVLLLDMALKNNNHINHFLHQSQLNNLFNSLLNNLFISQLIISHNKKLINNNNKSQKEGLLLINS